jgi:hypothetical protein
MSREGAISFRDTIGKLVNLRIECAYALTLTHTVLIA